VSAAGGLSWSQFCAAAPVVSAEVRNLFFAHGLGLGFLATVRRDGGPRVHPVCPLLADELYIFIIDGPKLRDLRRDPRYALHSETVAPPDHDDGAYLTGAVHELDDADLFRRLKEQCLAERDLTEPWPGFDEQALVELRIERALVTLTHPRHGLAAGHTVWAA
jgi:hypothetical protein